MRYAQGVEGILPGKRRCQRLAFNASTASSTCCPQIGRVFAQVVHSFVHRPGLLVGSWAQAGPAGGAAASCRVEPDSAEPRDMPPGPDADQSRPVRREGLEVKWRGSSGTDQVSPARRGPPRHRAHITGPPRHEREAQPNKVKSQIFPACRNASATSGQLRSPP